MLLRIVSPAALAFALIAAANADRSAAATIGSITDQTGAVPAAPAPTPPATPSPVPATYVRFVDAELLLGERVADQFSPNRTGRITNSLRAAGEFKFFGRNFLELEYRRWDPNHPDGLVTEPATFAQTFVPARHYAQQDVSFNNSLFGIGHTYVATSTLVHSTSENVPTLHSDFGIGIERLPDPTQPASIFGSYYYYPEVSGKLAADGGPRLNLAYKLETYRLGGSLAIPQTRAFLTANLVADHYLRKAYAPGNATNTSASLGIGYRL